MVLLDYSCFYRRLICYLRSRSCFHDTFYTNHVFYLISRFINLFPCCLYSPTLINPCWSRVPPGAPIVVSFPHFYQADPKYINAVDGLSPNKEDHETYLDLQPVRLKRDTPTSWSLVQESVLTLAQLFNDLFILITKRFI